MIPPPDNAVAAIAYLAHEVGDDAVEAAALEPFACLLQRQLLEVLGCLGHNICLQLHHNSAQRGSVAGAAQLQVQVDLGIGLPCRWRSGQVTILLIDVELDREATPACKSGMFR